MQNGEQPRPHVFAVNSSVAFLTLVREILQEAGYAVTTTNFVLTSFTQITTLQPDLLIIDVAAGEQVGWDLLARLHRGAETQALPVLVVSTDPRLLERAQADAARYGHHRYLEKPFDIDQLLACVEEMIGRS